MIEPADVKEQHVERCQSPEAVQRKITAIFDAIQYGNQVWNRRSARKSPLFCAGRPPGTGSALRAVLSRQLAQSFFAINPRAQRLSRRRPVLHSVRLHHGRELWAAFKFLLRWNDVPETSLFSGLSDSRIRAARHDRARMSQDD